MHSQTNRWEFLGKTLCDNFPVRGKAPTIDHLLLPDSLRRGEIAHHFAIVRLLDQHKARYFVFFFFLVAFPCSEKSPPHFVATVSVPTIGLSLHITPKIFDLRKPIPEEVSMVDWLLGGHVPNPKKSFVGTAYLSPPAGANR